MFVRLYEVGEDEGVELLGVFMFDEIGEDGDDLGNEVEEGQLDEADLGVKNLHLG